MLDYNLAKKNELPLYEYLYRCIRDDIVAGRIAADDRLPSKRALAQHLGVSVVTVESAYAQLVAEGYVRTRPRSGFYANALPGLPLERLGTGSSRSIERLGTGSGRSNERLGTGWSPVEPGFRAADSRVSPAAEGVEPVPNRPNERLEPVPNRSNERLEPVPNRSGEGELARLWSRALREALSTEPDSELFAPSPLQGSPRLRAAIADHLRQTRGMDVDPERIVVGAGAQILDNMLVQLLGHDLTYGVEDPGYLRLTSLYQANSVPVRHIPLDDEGVSMRSLAEQGVDVIHLMPSHQFPTGRVTTIARRYELLGWASSAPDRWIVEDDYDCEFRLAGRPVPALASIDAAQKVIYTNTFSKSLGAALRLAYMVLPDRLAQKYVSDLGFYSSTVSSIEQAALARLLESGAYERHVARMRKRSREARDRLIARLEASPHANRLHIEEEDSGLHFVLAVETDLPEPAVARKAWEEARLRLEPLSDYAWLPEHRTAPDGLARFVVRFDEQSGE